MCTNFAITSAPQLFAPNTSHALNSLTYNVYYNDPYFANFIRELVSGFSPGHIITATYQQLIPTSKPFVMNLKFAYIDMTTWFNGYYVQFIPEFAGSIPSQGKYFNAHSVHQSDHFVIPRHSATPITFSALTIVFIFQSLYHVTGFRTLKVGTFHIYRPHLTLLMHSHTCTYSPWGYIATS